MTQNIFPKTEEEILKFWQEKRIFQKTLEGITPKGRFVFYDGPPFATGLPHYGHIIASAIKDVIPRYKTMRGYKVNRRWGWDCHGLPIENLIEKELGLKTKKDIEKLGIDKFNQACRDSVLRYADEWKKFIPRMARWVDMENDYKTMDNRYIEVIWWIFKQLYEQELIYEGYKPMHLCPRCETTLSNFEVTLGYKEVKDLSVYVKFKLKTQNSKLKNTIKNSNLYLLSWTTTPWTLPGNTALAVGESIKYQIVKVKSQPACWMGRKSKVKSASKKLKIENRQEFYIVAKDKAKNVMKDKEYEIIGELKGKDLVGLEYEPLFDFVGADLVSALAKKENYQNAFKIYPADFVSTEEGTGIVHIAPAFGEDDYQLSQKYQIPFLQHINRDGTFKNYIQPWAGLKARFKDDEHASEIEIIKWLYHHNQLFAKEKYVHSYPHCWRCDTPLLNYAASSWFVKIDDDFKKRLLKANSKIKWVPTHLRDGRFGKWLEAARDWAISRSRYWGAPIPVWRCANKKCNAEPKVIGSIKELQEKLKTQNSKLSANGGSAFGGKTVAKNLKLLNLHKPYIDGIFLTCDKCGSQMHRIEEVFDCWFESGSMPYASELIFSDYQLTPQTTRQDILSHIKFPADFIAEGIDQTRGWFYTLLVLGVGLYNKSPFKNVVVNGIILAEDGQKMSKRLKNYPDPMDIINKYGADAMRFYLLSSPAVRGESFNFSEKGVDEVYKKVILLTLNVLKFWKTYARQYGKLGNLEIRKLDNVLDEWILARLEQLIREVDRVLDTYEIDKACRFIVEFINDLSTWYLRRSRERFKNQSVGADLVSAQSVGADLCVCPPTDKDALQILGYVLLELSKILASICPFLAEYVYQEIGKLGNCLPAELAGEIKQLESVHLEQYPAVGADLRVCPNTKLLKDMQIVRQFCEIGHSLRSEAGIKVRQVLRNFQFSIFNFQSISKSQFSIFKPLIADELNVKEVEIVDKLPQGEGWISKDGVALYTVIDEELKEEGIVRELTRQINNLRKKQGLTIEDRVVLEYTTESESLCQIIEKYKKGLMQAVLAREIRQQENLKGYQLNVGADLVSAQNVEREEVIVKLGN